MKMTGLEKVLVNSPTHSAQVSQHAASLLQRLPYQAGQTYLDVGCGNGAAPIHLATRYHLHVTGVDVDPNQVREAQERSVGITNARFYTLDATQLPFTDGAFDIVATNKTMHHIPDWPSAFDEMARVLKPGGYLIYSDLVFPNWLAALGAALAHRQGGFPTRAALERLVEKHQLRRIYVAPALMQYEVIVQKNCI